LECVHACPSKPEIEGEWTCESRTARLLKYSMVPLKLVGGLPYRAGRDIDADCAPVFPNPSAFSPDDSTAKAILCQQAGAARGPSATTARHALPRLFGGLSPETWRDRRSDARNASANVSSKPHSPRKVFPPVHLPKQLPILQPPPTQPLTNERVLRF
jgi:hypothetical protein